MSAQIVAATTRVSVLGPRGRVDLTVPHGTDVATVAAAYARSVGDEGEPRLSTVTGQPLDAASSLVDAGVQHGDLLTAQDGSAADEQGASGDVDGSASCWAWPSTRTRSTLLAAAAVCAAVGAALAATDAQLGLGRLVCGALLMVAGLVSAMPARTMSPRSARVLSAAAPAFGAAAGFVASYSSRSGGLLLGVAVAGLSAVVFAAIARATLDDDHDELTDVWLFVGSGVALVAAGLLLFGAPPSALLAVLYAAAVVAARLLPHAVVDVSDQALIDLDRLAVTAWSAREQPRGSRRRRAMVRPEGVHALVQRGRRLVSAGTVAIGLLVSVCGPALVLGADRDLTGIGSLAMVALGGVAMSLLARSVRSTLPRVALRAAAAWVLLVVGLDLLLEHGSAWDWWIFVAATVLAVVATTTGVMLGRGWRSVWWARAADAAEALSVVLVVAALPIASGLFDLARAFTS